MAQSPWNKLAHTPMLFLVVIVVDTTVISATTTSIINTIIFIIIGIFIVVIIIGDVNIDSFILQNQSYYGSHIIFIKLGIKRENIAL